MTDRAGGGPAGIAAATDFTVAVPGGEVFVRQWGAGFDGKAPIVLLHDSLGSVEQWRDFPAALSSAAQRSVIAYDRLGFGQSSPRSGRAALSFIGDEAAVHFPFLAKSLELDAYVLFGHSVGGAMALNIAAAAPDRCRAVITESAQAFVEAKTLASIRQAKADFADPARFSRLSRWHGERSRWVLDAWTEVWLDPEFRTWSLDASLAAIRCPVLAMHGDSDEYGSSAFPRRITTGVCGPARMEMLDACGHVPHREQATDVLRLVGNFMAEQAIL